MGFAYALPNNEFGDIPPSIERKAISKLGLIFLSQESKISL